MKRHTTGRNGIMAAQSIVLSREEIQRIAQLLSRTAGRNKPIVLLGPPGTGKTTMAFAIAATLGVPAYKVACNPDGTAQDILGGMSPDPDGSGNWLPFVPGPAALAWGATGEPGTLILDDLHEAGPGYKAALYTALDAGDGAAITLPNGKLLRPDPKYRVICTSNGDLDDLHPAVKSRLALRFLVLRPSQAMMDSLSAPIRKLVMIDYDGEHAVQNADFREWQTIDDTWHALKADGTEPATALSQACLVSLGDMERARALLLVMQTLRENGQPMIPEAADAVVHAFRALPSGAPR